MSWRTASKPSNDLGTHICIQLINLVKKYPALYLSAKISTPNQKKSRTEINEIWDDIARKIGLPVQDCKRRWKGLKDVYSKIRKRRLQEGTSKTTNRRRRWIYEDYMTFVKFPFEESYQEALEDFEEVDSNEWRMDQTESNDTMEQVSNDSDYRLRMKNREEIEDGTVEYLDLDLEVDSVPESEDYEVIHSLEKNDNSFDDETTDVHISMLEENSGHSMEVEPRSTFRAIRSKRYHPDSLSRNKSVGNRDAIVFENSASSETESSQIIVSNSTLRRKMNSDTSIVARKVGIYGMQGRGSFSSTSQGVMKLDSLNKNTRIESPLILNESKFPLHRLSVRSGRDSLELFFQSMAQTVMNLPMRVQAEIKMEICKIVNKAEIKYSVSQSTSNSVYHKYESKTG